MRESEELMEEAKNIVKRTVLAAINKNDYDRSYIKNSVKEELKTFLFKKTKRNPMILPIIMEV